MEKKVGNLTIKQFKSLLRDTIREELFDNDPDEGLELRDEVKNLLKESIRERQRGNQKTVFT